MLPYFDDYLLNLKVNNYSNQTIYNYERDLTVFQDFLIDAKLDFSKIQKKDILNYKAYLMSEDRLTTDKHLGEVQLSPYSTNRMLSALRSYLKYMIAMDYPTPIPPDAIGMSKVTKNKVQVPDLNEIIKIIEAPSSVEKNKKVALRNRAIFEVLFATGLRISELVNLRMDKIDKEGRIYVLGKGKKERFAYLTPRAIKYLKLYIKIRPSDSDYVFVPFQGKNVHDKKNKKISTRYVQERIKKYTELLGINVPVSPHIVRHAFATYLAEDGANPAAIQILLGHESLDTTTRYVHASDRYAEKTHHDFHPLMDDDD
ncbi:MAG: tyrosine-type recombinase/integrase [bacterium]|nr:tyrosine-type recombinase/integrase [bacterium]